MLIYGGAVNNFSGYHMIPVTQTLGITRTAFSFAESTRSIAGVVVTLFSGIIIQCFGFLRSISAALGVACVAYLIFANLQAYWMLILGCVLMGIAHGFCFTAGVTRLINGWFHKYRGTVIGMVNSKTTAVRIIPAPGKVVGDCVEMGGLLGSAPVMPVHPESSETFISRGGRIPAPLQSLKN